MRTLIALALVLVSCAAPPGAQATPSKESRTVAVATEDCGEARVLGELEALPVALPEGWSVAAECGDSAIAAVTEAADRVLTVWPESLTDDELRFVLLHETAHALDAEHMGIRERDLWSYARSLSGNWRACNPLVGGGQRVGESCWDPSEDYAESIAVCVTGEPGWRMEPHEVVPPGRSDCALALALAGLDVTVLRE